MKFSSSKKFKNKKFTTGFTLIEMVVVIGIFVIVTGIILANLPSFRRSSSLDLAAQEVAIQVRGAQVYAMSTVAGQAGSTGNIFSYILNIPAVGSSASKAFKLCYCGGSDSNICVNACNSGANKIENYLLTGQPYFSAYKTYNSGVWSIASTPINLIFKRPNGDLENSPGAHCILLTDSTADTRAVVVKKGGQITVNKTCPTPI
ncbi:MAG: prepilin-type N-terminal cleavage/methylation domain-containing protein [Candidatus Paceibacterota bacterium]|jgi:prepilin-type N-terminal cleavage/methylation domain-containing protein